ncbi:casein kinase i [Lichtheimia corymbifera JMRC:FSU:9682]|uniref:Casein kinase i n=1 Tax=Lichtheimia corymbifera JMRC:FSU:9682 TaxID=1263082 RepID=A0A068RSV6_9FUNG|nr:casein kinase i [Lichtheimia corymbifera JMRC:FSU:9682]
MTTTRDRQHNSGLATNAVPTKSTSSKSMSSSSTNIVGVHYRVGKKVGEGSFGVLYEGTNLLNNQSVAIKFEARKCEAPQLRDEYRTYKILSGLRKPVCRVPITLDKKVNIIY